MFGKRKWNMTKEDMETIEGLIEGGNFKPLVNYGADMYNEGIRFGKRYATAWWLMGLSIVGYGAYCVWSNINANKEKIETIDNNDEEIFED